MSSVEIDIKGLKQAQRFADALPSVVEEAAVLAVNDTAKFGHAEASRRIRSQVAFKAGYLGSAQDGGSSRLRIAKKASGGDTVAVIRARQRPTSLAEFAVGSVRRGKPVRVRVSPRGGTRTIPNAFPIRLRRGNLNVSEDAFNMGLAIRLKEGETVRNKRNMVQMSKGLYLLYGPSVDQVFTTVREDISDDVVSKLEDNFARHFDRLMAKEL